MTDTATLPSSAARETVWARALRIGLYRHGATPLYDAVVAELGYRPEAVRRGE